MAHTAEPSDPAKGKKPAEAYPMRPLPTGEGPVLLAGDVGGTKTWLATFRAAKPDSAAPFAMLRAAKLSSSSYRSLDELVEEFLADERTPVTYACFGIPGPVVNGKARLTNLPWEIDAAVLGSRFHFEGTFLINDLVANAYGIGELKREDFEILHEGDPAAHGNMAVISPGTGLGEAGIFWDGHKHIPFACEGGHTDFAPRTELELALLKFLFEPYGHVSYERVLSGSMGIPNIYRFLRDTGRFSEKPSIAEAIKREDPAAVICRAALEASCPLCIQTMEMFASILGAEAGNLALKAMATGGVFIGGGVAVKTLALLKRPLFLESFFAKGRFSSLMKLIPVRVIRNDRAALLGAARYALHGAESLRAEK